MSLPLYTVFICVAILFINVNGQCAGQTGQCAGQTGQCARQMEQSGSNAATTPRTIEVVRYRDQERPQYRPIVERKPPVVLQPTIQKFFMVPEKRWPTRYPSRFSTGCNASDKKDVSKDEYVMMPVAVRRKVVKKKKKSSEEDLE